MTKIRVKFKTKKTLMLSDKAQIRLHTAYLIMSLFVFVTEVLSATQKPLLKSQHVGRYYSNIACHPMYYAHVQNFLSNKICTVILKIQSQFFIVDRLI